jgi:hypothetical protein
MTIKANDSNTFFAIFLTFVRYTTHIWVTFVQNVKKVKNRPTLLCSSQTIVILSLCNVCYFYCKANKSTFLTNYLFRNLYSWEKENILFECAKIQSFSNHHLPAHVQKSWKACFVSHRTWAKRWDWWTPPLGVKSCARFLSGIFTEEKFGKF